VYLVKIGVQIATRPTWAFQKIPPEATGSNLARLGELGGKHLPHFPINRGRSEWKKCSAFLVIRESLEISEKNYLREENPSRGASVTFPWVISRRFSTVKFSKLNFSIYSMYPWWSSFVFMCFYFHFIYFPYPLLTCFSHLLKSFSHLIKK